MTLKYVVIGAIIATLLSSGQMVSASIVDFDDKPQEQEECEERSDHDSLCNGSQGVTDSPFCDLFNYNKTQHEIFFPNATSGSTCFDRERSPINFCATFDDLTSTYEYCRTVPGSQEFYEYVKTGGPDESCLFDVTQIKCQPDPLTDECPPDFGQNEDGRCFPAPNGEWKCPEGYHNTDDDESGQCYPNEGDEGCESEISNSVLLTDRPGKSDRCAYLGYICHEGDEESDHPRCEEYLENNN